MVSWTWYSAKIFFLCIIFPPSPSSATPLRGCLFFWNTLSSFLFISLLIPLILPSRAESTEFLCWFLSKANRVFFDHPSFANFGCFEGNQHLFLVRRGDSPLPSFCRLLDLNGVDGKLCLYMLLSWKNRRYRIPRKGFLRGINEIILTVSYKTADTQWEIQKNVSPSLWINISIRLRDLSETINKFTIMLIEKQLPKLRHKMFFLKDSNLSAEGVQGLTQLTPMININAIKMEILLLHEICLHMAH